MEDDATIDRLVNQCKSSDIDVRVDAVTKLQAECEAGLEITDPEPLISALKTCLRTPNQHLTTATLSALPPLIPLLISRNVSQPQMPVASASSSTSSTSPGSVVDAMTLRQVLMAFLPAGGVLERLGDSREKAKEKARETLVVIGGLAYRSAAPGSVSSKKEGKGPETPIMLFERFLREGGLGSKVWKVREQSILTLVHIRRAHHLFPIRPYLPQLVDALEDTDAHVRECARQSVVELFTGPGVSDAARADLKKEMTKKGVRKTIVDGVLSKVLAGASYPQSEGSENGDAAGPKAYVPPSLALQGRRPTGGTNAGGIARTVSHGSVRDLSRPASRAAGSPPMPPPPETSGPDVRPVYIASTRDLEHEFEGMIKAFEGKETEHNWLAREQSIQRVRGMLKGDVHVRYTDVLLACLKESFIKDSLKALASLRTTVSANTASLYAELAIALGPALDPWTDILLTNLLKMAGFTKKIAAQQSQASVTTVITNTSAQPRIVLPLLWNTIQEKTVQARAFAVAHVKNYIEVHGSRSKHAIEGSGGLDILEKMMKRSLDDANPTVRDSARVCFWVFEAVWPERGIVILDGLGTHARKELEKVCPNPERAAAVLPPATPKTTKKTSVSAAIAASRAKAKAIANAPPTLRHQATSTSHAVRATSPPLKRAPSPSVSRSPTSGPSSPSRIRSSLSSPPSPPRSRVVSSSSVARSTSSGAPGTHSRTASGNIRSASPSPVDQSTFRRRTSSPLASPTGPNRQSVIHTTGSVPLHTNGVHVSPTPRQTNGRSSVAIPVPPRHSLFNGMQGTGDDESLLLATAIPIPEDSDSDNDDSVNLMSFSTPFELYPPKVHSAGKSSPAPLSPAPKSTSQIMSSPRSAPGVSNALSTGSPPPGQSEPIIEDAMRARAEQAESAADRLLELVDPEEDGQNYSTIPSSLLMGSGRGAPKSSTKAAPAPVVRAHVLPPVTPINRNAQILRQAALFKNSPAQNGSSASLMNVLKDRRDETGWWLKRMSIVEHGTPLKAVQAEDRVQELQTYIAALENGDASIRVLQKLALLCIENPVMEPPSPTSSVYTPASPSPFILTSRALPSLHPDMWTNDKSFERLFNALIKFLDPSQAEDQLEHGLIVLWEMLENQAPNIEGREADIFSVLLKVRYCSKLNVLEATNTIRDALTARIEPVYGLTTMHASLRAFHAEAPPSFSDADAKAATYAFGLVALGKFILRLPDEILEEELPRLKATLISALNDKSSLVVRESAAASIIAAQLVLRDETHLFTLLDGLADEKKNLLTYLFDKHGARGLSAAPGPSDMDKLEKEMRRLDTRTSTPPRPIAA
ncbi:hypothetical protein PLICRDRAFT_48721 [Plicaturopsis crispa FD-325 SS-3]|nr:hypothetical protein PLICRDRAFT_48721 [Plicaturopsis crispa FD-325 SS-3]